MVRGFGNGGRNGSGGRGGGSRGGYSGTGGKANRGPSHAGNSSPRPGTRGNAGKPKGQVKDGKTVQYSIKGPKGSTKYIGTTNNPSRRASEHRESGKLGRNDKLVVETKPIPRSSAERVEAAKLRSYRDRHGRNPRHNATNDGKFHQIPLF